MSPGDVFRSLPPAERLALVAGGLVAAFGGWVIVLAALLGGGAMTT